MMKKPWLSAILNFFLAGPGTFYNGRRKPLGVALTLAAIGLTYVELNVQTLDTTLWGVMFVSVFLMNTFLAIDGYQEARAINEALNEAHAVS
ncbi:MAG: hypothetical protein ACE5H9_21700 [Anaerolineae bacterium]